MNNNISMEELMDSFELKHFHKGDIVKGKVISIKNDEIVVNIGHFADGIIPKNELSNDINFDMNSIKIDDEIYVMVLSGDDGEGNVLLSKKKADFIKAWTDIEDIFKNNKYCEVNIKEVIKGGLIGTLEGIRVFMPRSQCAARRVENLETLVGKTLEVKIIEFDKKNNKVVISRRIVEEEILKNEKRALWDSIKNGEKRIGTVTKLVKFGAFVNIGGVEGLIHINDLSWSRVNNPEEVVSVGDEVEVFVQDVDKAKERISLSLKDIITNPWDTIEGKYVVGTVLTGKVSKFIKVGVFVELEPGIEGFVHISEITDDNIVKSSDLLSLGQEVKVKILDVKEENHKISLSIKDAIEKSVEYLKYNDEESGFSLSELFKELKL